MRYSLTKFAAAAWVACTCMSVLGTPPEARADTTTYLYTGSPLQIHTDLINVGNCLFPPLALSFLTRTPQLTRQSSAQI
jgi:hypothetical protein